MENEQRKMKMAKEERIGGQIGGGGGGEDYLALSSPTGGGGGERVKLFCSHGGKILPRPPDGTLKYVGGETRVVAVPREITFSGLIKKIKSVFDGEYVLKYQIALEDLDCLVSVKSDEDTRHLLDEYDRLEREGSSKLRVYLFPIKQASNTSRGIKSFSPSPTNGSPPQSLSPRSNMAMNQNNCIVSRIARFHRVASSPANLDSQHNHVVVHPNGYIPSQLYHHGYHNPSYLNPMLRGYPGSTSHGWSHLEQYVCGSSQMIKGDVLPP